MADPSTLTDDELDKVIETGEEPVESPPEEEVETPQEEVEEEPVADEEPAEDEQEEAPAAPSRREQLRVQALLKKYGPPPKEAPRQEPAAKAPDFRQMIDADDEVYRQLEETSTSYGQDQRNQGRQESLQEIQTVKWETLLNVDAPQVETKYPQLDPNSQEFHPALSDAMSRRYLNMVGFDERTGLVANPGIRWKDFVESEFELADEIAATKIATTQKNITKQAAQTGLRPDGSRSKRLNLNQAPESMSDEELDAVIGSALPKK